MGEAGRDALRVHFDRTVKFEFHGAKVSSSAGLFTFQDLDVAVQPTETAAVGLLDFCTGHDVQHSMTALLRQSVDDRAAGDDHVNDAERVSVEGVGVAPIGQAQTAHHPNTLRGVCDVNLSPPRPKQPDRISRPPSRGDGSLAGQRGWGRSGESTQISPGIWHSDCDGTRCEIVSTWRFSGDACSADARHPIARLSGECRAIRDAPNTKETL